MCKPAYRPRTNLHPSSTTRPSTVSRPKHKASHPAQLVRKQPRQPGGVLGGAPAPSTASRLDICARRVSWAAARSLQLPAVGNVPPARAQAAQAAGLDQQLANSTAPLPPLNLQVPLPLLGHQLVAIPNIPTDNRYSVLSEMTGN